MSNFDQSGYELLLADAQARQRGQNLDGTARRETYDRIPAELHKRAEAEVAIFGMLFTDTAAKLAAEGIDVKQYEHMLLDRLSLD